MAQDIEFRRDMKNMLDEGSDEYEEQDFEIIKYVLNHALNQWSASLVRWWYEKGAERGKYFL